MARTAELIEAEESRYGWSRWTGSSPTITTGSGRCSTVASWEHAATAPFSFVAGVEAAIGAAQDRAGDRVVDCRDHHVGVVSGFAPPGDIHRARNTSETTAISITLRNRHHAGSAPAPAARPPE